MTKQLRNSNPSMKVLLHVGLSVGDSAKVDDLLAIIGPEGTDVTDIANNFSVQVDKMKLALKLKMK